MDTPVEKKYFSKEMFFKSKVKDERLMISYDFKRGLSGGQSLDRLHRAYADEAPSLHSVKSRFNEFQRARVSLQEEQRGGSRNTAVNNGNAAGVRALIEAELHG